MTISDLVREYYRHNPDGHFFDRETLKYFGETLSTMRVLKDTVTFNDYCGNPHTCYVVSRLQKKFPGGPRRSLAYFDTTTFDDICYPS
jgi:hypothetical protein